MTSVVINPFFHWGSDRAPRTPYHETVIYEAHVKGMTQTHPGIPEELRGTYAGLAHPVIIDHLKSLNVTAIELMPVHQFLHDHRLLDLGLRNYWGYNTFGFFAPHTSTRPTGTPAARWPSSRRWCRSFHEAGIEVILDVVYNHTAEGNHLGPDASTSAASTTPPTTGCSTATCGTTRTSPAPATASTPATRTHCS